MHLDDIKNITLIIGAIVGCLSLIKAVYEYTRQARQKRAEEFFRLDKEFMDGGHFDELFELLEDDDEALQHISISTRMRFLRFYEDIALMCNSGLMRPYVAHYMFAYYAVRCMGSKHFWVDLNIDSPYWALFVSFATKMKKLESNFVFDDRHYKL